VREPPGPDRAGRGEVVAALARARAFVARAGSPLARLRADALAGEAPAARLAAFVESRQLASGAVGPLEGDGPADAATTAAALALLDELGALEHPCAERAAVWLASTQAHDGSFDPAPDAGADARLLFTASVAARLARTGRVRERVLDAAGAYVAAGFSVERVQRGDWEAIAALLPFFADHPGELADAALQWCGRELERGWRTGRFDAVRAARVFVLCRAHALPGAKLDARELVPALLADQAGDGGFGAADGPEPERVERTLDAMLALARLG
jgi:hypothetical protein